MALTRASDAERSMSTNATRARWAQRCSTIEAPMPLPPPVTNATRPSRLGYDAVRIMRSSLCTMDLITLRAGGAGLVLAPEAGGSVARYRIERGGTAWELLRPWPAPRVDDVFGSAGFALVPYPWAFRATQHFALSPANLSVALT